MVVLDEGLGLGDAVIVGVEVGVVVVPEDGLGLGVTVCELVAVVEGE
jgi:hypothetical protein